MYRAWETYVPGYYPGSLLLIRAEVADVLPGVDDTDPQMGWGPLIGGGIEVVSLNCHHVNMLDVEHAPALAALLHAGLDRANAKH
jgi:thioesterase domain-containing protein